MSNGRFAHIRDMIPGEGRHSPSLRVKTDCHRLVRLATMGRPASVPDWTGAIRRMLEELARMKLRVFIPRPPDSSDGPAFNGTDHNFPVLPSVGHVLRFNDRRAGDFTVVGVGFVQDAAAFLPAVWLEANAKSPTYSSDPPDAGEPPDRFRDLNYDVPPASMTGY